MRKSPRSDGRIGVVIDTNVLVSAALQKGGYPARVFEQISEGHIINFTSEEILQEMRQVMDREKIRKLLSLSERQFIISAYEANSILVKPSLHFEVIFEDVDDNKFLDCAIEADVEFIITGDKHLLSLRRFRQIEVVSPREFSQGLN